MIRRPKLVAAFAFAATLLIGCKSSETKSAPPEPPAANEGWDKPQVSRYSVHGEVVRLPLEGAPSRELVIRHERIPDFKGATGEVVGMDAMAMPFPLAPGVAVEGLEPGDKLTFEFAMDWPNNRYRIEKFQELPRDTVLEFGKGEK